MAGSQRWQNDNHISGDGVQPDENSIEDVNLTDTPLRSTLKFIVAFATGAFVFFIPIQWQRQTAIPLDVIMTLIQNASMTAVDVFSLVLISAGGILTTISELHYRNIFTVSEQTEELLQLDYWQTSIVFWAFRVIAIGFALSILLNVGPAWILVDPIVNTAWGALVITVALVIPIGSIFVNLLAELGGLQFIGTLAQPICVPYSTSPVARRSTAPHHGSDHSVSATTSLETSSTVAGTTSATSSLFVRALQPRTSEPSVLSPRFSIFSTSFPSLLRCTCCDTHRRSNPRSYPTAFESS